MRCIIHCKSTNSCKSLPRKCSDLQEKAESQQHTHYKSEVQNNVTWKIAPTLFLLQLSLPQQPLLQYYSCCNTTHAAILSITAILSLTTTLSVKHTDLTTTRPVLQHYSCCNTIPNCNIVTYCNTIRATFRPYYNTTCTPTPPLQQSYIPYCNTVLSAGGGAKDKSFKLTFYDAFPKRQARYENGTVPKGRSRNL